METIREINTNTIDGQYLLASIAMLTIGEHSNKTPDEVLKMIVELSEKMFNGIDKK